MQVVVASLNESLTQILESFDINLVQTHVPHQCGTRQTILETMDEKLIITYLSRHLSHVHRQMSLTASVPFVFFKFENLELGRYHNIGNQAKITSTFPKQVIPTKSFQFQLYFIKFSFQFIYLVICSHTFQVIDGSMVLLSSVNQR